MTRSGCLPFFVAGVLEDTELRNEGKSRSSWANGFLSSSSFIFIHGLSSSTSISIGVGGWAFLLPIAMLEVLADAVSGTEPIAVFSLVVIESFL